MIGDAIGIEDTGAKCTQTKERFKENQFSRSNSYLPRVNSTRI